MATLKAMVRPTHKKADNTYSVYIRLTHNRQSVYIQTDLYAHHSQLKKDFSFKDPDLLEATNGLIKSYRSELLKISTDLPNHSAKSLAEFLKNSKKPKSIDFVAFSESYITKLKDGGRQGTAENLTGVVNSLVDFFGTKKVTADQINLKFLNDYSVYLKTERKVTRINRNGASMNLTLKPLSSTGIRDYIGRIRNLFNEARKKYNDEDLGIIKIPHYPFSRFDIPKVAPTRKRTVKSAIIKLIRDTPDIQVANKGTENRVNFARDIFMLSFYLVGINTVDLFNLTDFNGARITYYRRKIQSRVGERAKISIKVEDEVRCLFERFADDTGERVFKFHKMYDSHDSFNKSYNEGLKVISKYHKEQGNFDVVLTGGHARASWATIARNEAGVIKEDIHLALNHSDTLMKVTDIYLDEDYSIIDRANRKVLDLLK